MPEDVDTLYDRLKAEAEGSGYHLNPDVELTKDLLAGIVTNQERYGYWACPCRLASGNMEEDLDIICPCNYRDPDLVEYDCCYCALYVSQAVLDGEKGTGPIPERRPPPGERKKAEKGSLGDTALSHPVWRCGVCGYLCARDGPPEVCPICKAKKERFQRFI